MKKISIILLASLLVVACDKYDDTELSARLDTVESDVAALESELEELAAAKDELDSRITAFDSVTAVEAVEVDGRDGYKISFLNSEPIVLLNGKDGEQGDKGATGADGANPAADGSTGADGAQGDKGATGDAGDDAYVQYTDNGDNTVTIKLWNTTTSVYDEYIFPIVVASTGSAAFMTLGGDTGEETLSSSAYSVAINLPSTLLETDYKAILAEVVREDGASGSSVVTRVAGDSWTVTITKPTFTGGVYDDNAAVEIVHTTDTTQTSGVLEVTYIDSDGAKTIVSTRFTYN